MGVFEHHLRRLGVVGVREIAALEIGRDARSLDDRGHTRRPNRADRDTQVLRASGIQGAGELARAIRRLAVERRPVTQGLDRQPVGHHGDHFERRQHRTDRPQSPGQFGRRPR